MSPETEGSIVGGIRRGKFRTWPFRNSRSEEKPVQEKLPVAQRDPTGCAIACVAYVLGKSYEECLWLFEGGRRRARFGGFGVSDIKIALARGRDYYLNYYFCGDDYIAHKIIDEEKFKPDTVVFIRISDKYPEGHYLVKTPNNTWMDPWINYPNPDVEAGFRANLPDIPTHVVGEPRALGRLIGPPRTSE